ITQPPAVHQGSLVVVKGIKTGVVLRTVNRGTEIIRPRNGQIHAHTGQVIVLTEASERKRSGFRCAAAELISKGRINAFYEAIKLSQADARRQFTVGFIVSTFAGVYAVNKKEHTAPAVAGYML